MVDEQNLKLDVSIKTAAHLLYAYIQEKDRFHNPYRAFVEDTGQTERYKEWVTEKNKEIVSHLFNMYTEEELKWIRSHKDEFIRMLKRDNNE